MSNLSKRLLLCFKLALKKASKTVIWLLKIILPISLFVSFLQFFGVIDWMSLILSPFFAYLGLPGEAAIVFISSIFLALYAPIAIIATLPLGVREMTILALMCLISHNMIVETAVQRKTGSSPWIIFPLRLLMSVVSALLLNWLLPAQMGDIVGHVQTVIVHESIWDMLWAWCQMAFFLVLKMSAIVSGLMFLQAVLKEFKILDVIARLFAPFMKLMGLSRDSSFLWFVAQTVGLTYGSAVLLEELEEHDMPRQDVNLLNYHIAINHSLLEDTSLFWSMGVPLFWITIPRFLLAVAFVWLVRAYRRLVPSV